MEENKNFIGKTCKIIKTKNNTQINLQGTIINETKNTFTLKTKNKEKTVLKATATFVINNEQVEGKKLTKRIEDRIKSRGKYNG